MRKKRRSSRNESLTSNVYLGTREEMTHDRGTKIGLFVKHWGIQPVLTPDNAML